jgi:hypothetical protein
MTHRSGLPIFVDLPHPRRGLRTQVVTYNPEVTMYQTHENAFGATQVDAPHFLHLHTNYLIHSS